MNFAPSNLIPCPDCHRKISPKARMCPGCGRPGRRPWGAWLFGFSVALLLAGVAFFVLLRQSPPPAKSRSAPSSSQKIWTCSMHPQIEVVQPGKCPICAMDLIPHRKK